MRSHGHVATYNAGCRCSACTLASAVARQRSRQRVRQQRRRPWTSGRPELQEPLDWFDQAACATVPIDVFFPSGGVLSYRQAKRVCSGCPVRAECLDYAVRTRQPEGCWGGLTPDERFQLEDRMERTS